MSDRARLRRFLMVYALGQLAVLMLFPAVAAANMESVSSSDPLGLSGMGAKLADAYSDGGYWVAMAVYSLIVFALQAASLSGVRRPAPCLSKPTMVWASALTAGLTAVPLLVSVVFLVVIIAPLANISLPPPNFPPDVRRAMPLIVLGLVLSIWTIGTLAAWMVITRRAARLRSYERAMAGVCRGILVTVVTLAVPLVPLDIRARLNPPYEMHMTIPPIAILSMVLLTVAGPLLVLVRLRRLRVGWYAARCDRCGYEKGPPGEFARCPECGEGWLVSRPSGPLPAPAQPGGEPPSIQP